MARLSRDHEYDDLNVTFGIVTPDGLWITPTADQAAHVAMSGEYLIIRLQELPLREEGIHRFEVGLSNGSMASLDIPVWLCDQPAEQVH